jgi:hypothetical protein
MMRNRRALLPLFKIQFLQEMPASKWQISLKPLEDWKVKVLLESPAELKS